MYAQLDHDSRHHLNYAVYVLSLSESCICGRTSCIGPETDQLGACELVSGPNKCAETQKYTIRQAS
jgi:hypothetical protein